jgi:hypothetical protein
MKWNYIIGTAVLLVALVATNYYINDYRKLDADSKLSGAPGMTTTSETTNDMAPAQPVIASAIATDGQTPQPSVAATKRHAIHQSKHSVTHHGALAETNDIYEEGNDIPEEEEMFANGGRGNVIVAEKSADYYGNTPQNSTGETEKKHHHFHMPQNLGVEIGVNQSSLENTAVSVIPRGNVAIGLLYNLNIGNHLAFQPGVRYVTKGVRLQNDLDGEVREKLSTHYLQVPANFVVKFGKPGNTRFMVGGGPYAAMLLGAKDKFQSPGFSDGSDVLNPAKPQYQTNNLNNFDWGFNGFLGIQSPEGIFIKAGAEYGMKDIMKSGAAAGNNTNIMVSCGFILGRKL